MKRTFKLGLILAASALSLTISSCGSSSDDSPYTDPTSVTFMPEGYNTAQFTIETESIAFSVYCHNTGAATGTITPGQKDLAYRSDDRIAQCTAGQIYGGSWVQTSFGPTALYLSITLETQYGTVTIPDLQIALDMTQEEANKNLSSYMDPYRKGSVSKGTVSLEYPGGDQVPAGTYTAKLGGKNGRNSVEISYTK